MSVKRLTILKGIPPSENHDRSSGGQGHRVQVCLVGFIEHIK